MGFLLTFGEAISAVSLDSDVFLGSQECYLLIGRSPLQALGIKKGLVNQNSWEYAH